MDLNHVRLSPFASIFLLVLWLQSHACVCACLCEMWPFVFAFVWAHMCALMGIHVYVCWGLRSTMQVFFNCLALSIWRRGLSDELRTPAWVQLGNFFLGGSFVFPSLVLELQTGCCILPALLLVLGIWILFLILHGQVLYPLRYLHGPLFFHIAGKTPLSLSTLALVHT